MYILIYAMTFIEEKVLFWEKRPPPPIKNSGYGPVPQYLDNSIAKIKEYTFLSTLKEVSLSRMKVHLYNKTRFNTKVKQYYYVMIAVVR